MFVSGDYQEIRCWKCDVTYCLPTDLHRAAKRDSKISFFCPHGHSAHYPEGETSEDKIRRERDRLKQETARLEQERVDAVLRAEKAERATKRLKKRAASGVCPCCNRTFSNMAAHMHTQHPEFLEEKPKLKVVK